MDEDETERLSRIADTLLEMVAWVIQFDTAFRDLREMQEQARFHNPFDDSASRNRRNELTETLLNCRRNIMQRQDDVSKFLTSVGLPSEWHVSPMPAIGGPVEIYNIFDAFIAITGDIDPKPNLIHITDLLEKGKLACIRCLKEYSENPPNRTMEKAKAVPKHIGSAISWFFPTEKQRATLGWIVIATLILLILRYLLGIHLEEAGKLILKVFKIDK